jgi:hypothetical protein
VATEPAQAQADGEAQVKTYGGRRAASRHLQGFVPCILAHHWRGIIYRGASLSFENWQKKERIKNNKEL